MSAKQIPLRLPSGSRRAKQIPLRFKPGIPSGHCLFCSGSGWRPVRSGDDHHVTRCECRTERRLEEMKIVAVADRKSVDRKSAAAGER